MNNEQRNIYWLQWERRRSRIESEYRRKIFLSLQNQVQISLANKDSLQNIRNNTSEIRFEEVGNIIKALYIRSGLFQANIALREARQMQAKYATMGFNKEWTDAILNYFRLHLLNKAVLPITETTKAMIRKILDRATVEGWSVEQTVREILRYTTEINRHRANVIVRTESVRAMNVGTILGADKSSIVLDKEWITARDERVRSSHRHLHGKVLDIEDIFDNGCAFPGDPNGSAKETINCRCTIALVPKRDENGRVIRKPAGQVFVNDTRRQGLGRIAEGIASGIAVGTLLDQIIND